MRHQYTRRQLTYLIPFVLYVAHKVVTSKEKCCLSDAQRWTWLQVQPTSLISFSTELLHVNFGRPLFFFPAGVHLIATLGIAFRVILCHIQRHLLLLISTDSGAVKFFVGDGSWPKNLEYSPKTSCLKYIYLVAYRLWDLPGLCHHIEELQEHCSWKFLVWFWCQSLNTSRCSEVPQMPSCLW